MRRALPAAGFCVGYLAGNFLAATLHLPLLWHLPVERRFEFTVQPLGLGSDFYGRVLFSLFCGAIGAALSALFAGDGRDASRLAARRKAQASWLGTLLGWSLSLLLLLCSLHVWMLAGRRPVAASLPEDHAAR